MERIAKREIPDNRDRTGKGITLHSFATFSFIFPPRENNTLKSILAIETDRSRHIYLSIAMAHATCRFAILRAFTRRKTTIALPLPTMLLASHIRARTFPPLSSVCLDSSSFLSTRPGQVTRRSVQVSPLFLSHDTIP